MRGKTSILGIPRMFQPNSGRNYTEHRSERFIRKRDMRIIPISFPFDSCDTPSQMICIEDTHLGEDQELVEATFIVTEGMTIIVGRSYRGPLNNTIRDLAIDLGIKGTIVSAPIVENMPLK